MTTPSPTPRRTSQWLWVGVASSLLLTLCFCVGVLWGGYFAMRANGPSTSSTGRPVSGEGLVYDPNADADADIAAALSQAQAEDKRVLLDFGADWCVYCVELNGYFEDPDIKPFLDAHFVVVKIDIGYGTKNSAISRRYGDPVQEGVPAIVILDADGRMVTSSRDDGSMEPAFTEEYVLQILQQWAAAP